MDMSIVEAILTQLFSPSSVIKLFSGEIDGHVTKYPFSSSISQSTKNSAQLFIIGYISFKNLTSLVNS